MRKIVKQKLISGNSIVDRLMSPNDFGEHVKPFVFLDRFDVPPSDESEIERDLIKNLHPHSGISTVTVLLEGKMYFVDSAGRQGTLKEKGVEYMQAGNGVWHTGSLYGDKNVKGFQLWLALPPHLENHDAHSTYLGPDEVKSYGPARIILGEYHGVKSTISYPTNLTYLHVKLKKGERWSFEPKSDHDVAWVALFDGELESEVFSLKGGIHVFEEGNENIPFKAIKDTEFVIASSSKHPHPLFLGPHSVHTNEYSLREGLMFISTKKNDFRLMYKK